LKGKPLGVLFNISSCIPKPRWIEPKPRRIECLGDVFYLCRFWGTWLPSRVP
jgi:hypothetical protein